ncbi:hypothetical protein EGH21_07270 [Halomicroarcula sp. F13]|uniref:Glycosyltransferase RgtA/B/C/D-like domain-containing protein n=1 Tax=Haloarcula rubra TaxID=2487747 RepID=A0AAW4PRN8_9EURY|nr:hypothetical protein [Halomicroarcula rubra]MBX0322829.1 hypothetical protein [Halomicroarcula rubra]
MSGPERVRRRLRTAARWAFADRYGLVLWLGLLCWFGLTWRVGVFIQDTYATANTLVALADGQLHVTEIRYSLTLGSQPGLHRYDGLLYGRNYGQLALAVPLVWALEGVATVVDPRLLLAGLWAGLGLAFVTQVGRLDGVDRERTVTAGSVVVALLFAGSVLTATNLDPDRLALAAYQLSTMAAAATAGLLLYRLVADWHGRRIGLAAGAALGLATPVGFWATIPKRHTLVAALVLATVYAFAVSRRTDGRTALRARAAAYAFAGAITWVHAFEAFFVVGVLGIVDLLTARSNRPRDLLVVGLVLLLAATPMLATNYAISGNPAEPPRLLPNVDGGDVEFSPDTDGGADGSGGTDGANSGTDGGSGSTGSGGDGTSGTQDGESARTPPDTDPVGSFVESTVDTASSTAGAVEPIWTFAGGAVADGVDTLDEPARLSHVFVRSGHVPGVSYRLNDYEVIELTLLEATPILGALLAVPVLAGRRLTGVTFDSLRPPDPRTLSPRRQTDSLVVALAVVLTVVYLPRLPLFSQLTVRYLHPVVPLAVYGVCRVPAVRTAVVDETAWLWRAYVGSLLLAVTVVLGGIVGLGLALGEAVQYHALWNLAAATVCALAVVGRTLAPERVTTRTVAAGLALPAGFTTAFLALSGLVYFEYGTYAFDLVRVVADLLPTL